MADEQRPQPEDPWVAPPLGSDGNASGTYQDPFAQQAAPSIPPPPGAPYGQPMAAPGQPYAAPGYSQQWGAPGQQYAPRTDKNWMGITSLILSLVGVSLGGIILGHLGLGAAKRGEASNRGVALAGTIVGWVGLALSVVWVVVIIGLSLFAGSSSFESTWESDVSESAEPYLSEPADDWADDLAEPGDGVFGLEEANNYFLVYVDGALDSQSCLAPSASGGYDLDAVDCDDPHVGEVFLTAPLSDLIVGDDVYGDATWTEMYNACTGAFDASANGSDVDFMVDWWVFAASDDSELSDDDTFLCVASVDFSETTGSFFDGSSGQSL